MCFQYSFGASATANKSDNFVIERIFWLVSAAVCCGVCRDEKLRSTVLPL